jgi:tRNA/rRNA methyltransferase
VAAEADDRDGSEQTLKGCAAPAVVLVAPQLGENIGTAARAMLNCGLTDLRLVRPRDGWPSEKAVAAASGAESVLERARLFETTEEAIADLNRVYATTARRRGLVKPVMTPQTAAAEMRGAIGAGEKAGVMFGPERKGLHNDDVMLAAKIIEAPLNSAHTSLNLAQAVLLVGWEWWKAADATPGEFIPALVGDDALPPAPARDIVNLFEHLEGELDAAGYFFPPHKKRAMVYNLRTMLQRAQFTEQEVRTLRGVVKALSQKRKGR